MTTEADAYHEARDSGEWSGSGRGNASEQWGQDVWMESDFGLSFKESLVNIEHLLPHRRMSWERPPEQVCACHGIGG